jgi:hypothetical protein
MRMIVDQSQMLVNFLFGNDATVFVEGGGTSTPSLTIKFGGSELSISPDGELTTKQLDFVDELAATTARFRDAMHGWTPTAAVTPPAPGPDRAGETGEMPSGCVSPR